MVFYFKGQVKISDVQRELNSLVTAINELIDAYNASDYVQDMDYSNGSGSLAPSGYTLTVGGLKTILAAYANKTLGFKVFYRGILNNNPEYVVSDGIIFTASGTIRVPMKLIAGQGKYLYYNTTSSTYQFSETKLETSDTLYFITRLNNNRAEKYANSPLFTTEERDGYEIYIPKLNSSIWHDMPFTVDNTNPRVIAGNEAVGDEGQPWRESFFLGNPANANQQAYHRGRAYYAMLSWLLLPKGVSNPFSYNYGSTQKVWNVNFVKPDNNTEEE